MEDDGGGSGVVALGEGGHDRESARYHEERTGRRNAALQTIWSECGVVSFVWIDLQCFELFEKEIAGEIPGSPTEAIAF